MAPSVAAVVPPARSVSILAALRLSRSFRAAAVNHGPVATACPERAAWAPPRQRSLMRPALVGLSNRRHSSCGSSIAMAGALIAAAASRRSRHACSSVRAASSAKVSSPCTASDFLEGMGDAAAARVGDGAEVILVPCLGDNYAPVLHDAATGHTAVIDTPDAEPILAAVKSRGWTITHILNTHHHWDHTAGNSSIKQHTGCEIIGPAGEESAIPELDLAVKEGDRFHVGSFQANVLAVGGHTLGHIAYHFPAQRLAFVGDTLFVLGCGRLFEGTPAQMWASLSKLRALPDDTVIYCGHEYTMSNLRFATHLGGVPGISERAKAIHELRAASKPTVPMLLAHETATNPFLRADTDEVRSAAGLPSGATSLEVFTEIRRQKDQF
eukprot:TRINITY_DN21695_c0_g1_i1.p1 TRINITY_DN21695_c0_g1~~TRINITY_DN21695_c0_g1_i1.p1  ORF type:complete len:394 (+),score=59.42 TRINITY_DN21695_c0_g1_i1:36-1184(+)